MRMESPELEGRKEARKQGEQVYAPLKWVESGVYGDLILMYLHVPKAIFYLSKGGI